MPILGKLFFMKIYGLLFLSLMGLLMSACNHDQKTIGVMGVNRPSFEKVAGIKFTEVRRAYNTGTIFDDKGFQMKPGFKMSFMSDDSAMVYNPGNKKFSSYPIYFDEDSIINIARIWFKPTKITKDSMILRLLKVGEDSVLRMKKSLIFMTFYADNYLKKLSPAQIEKLSAPRRLDTMYIRKKAETAGFNPDSAFGALVPPVFVSRSQQVKVERIEIKADAINEVDASLNYLLPEYVITINKAYDDFTHGFFMVVDAQGKLHFDKATIELPKDLKENYESVMKGIIDGYLTHYLTVTPGYTLGIPHSSIVKLRVTGIQ